MKKLAYLLSVLVFMMMIPHVFAQQPPYQCGALVNYCYQDTGFRLTSKPVLCIDTLSDTTFGHKMNLYTVQFAKEWYQNVQTLSSASSPICNISIHFQAKPTPADQANVTDAVGVTYYDYYDHSAKIEIFLDKLAFDDHGNPYYDDNSLAPDYQLQWAIKHELGHAFGLGHYMTGSVNGLNIVSEPGQPISASVPSIMIPVIPDPTTTFFSDYIFNADITKMDLNELHYLYPNGFSDQSFQQVNTNMPSVPTPEMSSSDINYWTPIIRNYFENSTNTIYSSDYSAHVLELVDILDSENLTTITDPVGNNTNMTFYMQMPPWLANSISYWANGEISDKDLASDMQYLYNNGMFYFKT